MKNDSMPTPSKKLSPLKSIKSYCKKNCCCDDQISWKRCTATKCVLYPYRLGIGNRLKVNQIIEKPCSRLSNQAENNQSKTLDLPKNTENQGEVDNA